MHFLCTVLISAPIPTQPELRVPRMLTFTAGVVQFGYRLADGMPLGRMLHVLQAWLLVVLLLLLSLR